LDKRTTGLVLVLIGIVGLLAFPLYSGLAWNNPPRYGLGIPWNPGMIGPPPRTGTVQVSFDEAVDRFQNYVSATVKKDLALMEVMEFENNFYAIVYEKDSGMGAFELLIWKRSPSFGMMGGGMMSGAMMTGAIVPEPGPNMMWNTKYSMMRGGWQTTASDEIPVSEQEARSAAESHLSQYFPGAHVEGIARFYGYYTLDFERDGKIIGMLSVNGYTRQAWYHSWHGYFIQEKEFS